MTNLKTALWCDLTTDAERSAWLLLGRGYETGVVAKAMQNDLARAYERLAQNASDTEIRQLREENEKIKQVIHLTGLKLTDTEIGVRLTNFAGMQLMQVGDAEWMREKS